ncbi:MAG TPA: choice-of-anchor tandem repeat GloVer-containing protein [Bryobacteraceae bacterium]|nr:choice-of-anchor tandem repeat GloVer-containing protein [Bryobacteraceae bacterium]
MPSMRDSALLRLALCLSGIGTAANAATFTILHSFGSPGGPGDGYRPLGSLAIGHAGVLYGTTGAGGSFDEGTIFSLTPPTTSGGAWTETLLYSFGGFAGDALGPIAGVTIGRGGALYGTTGSGGAYGYGTVFELAPPASPTGAWTETVLHSFGAGEDGNAPYAGVAIDSNGVLYGTTEGGGTTTFGTVFSLAPPASPGGDWTETVLYAFGENVDDGAFPRGGVVIGSGGTLYGAASGGSFVSGAVFELTPPSTPDGTWTETLLAIFYQGGTGVDPEAAPILAGDGTLYGTTELGGYVTQGSTCAQIARGCGTVYQVLPPSAPGGKWTETAIYRFTDRYGDAFPLGGVVMGANGALYGVTSGSPNGSYGTCDRGCGAVFELSPPETPGGDWTQRILHAFTNQSDDGGFPLAGLVIGANGVLYGTTFSGGAQDGGVVFSVE